MVFFQVFWRISWIMWIRLETKNGRTGQEKSCYVPTSHTQPHVHVSIPIPLTLTPKGITLIGYIASDGPFFKSLIVTHRKRYDADLALTGATDENLSVYSQSKEDTDRHIFLAWLTEVFLPEVTRRCEAFCYSGAAVLVISSCSADVRYHIDELRAA
jgi:hypothetical protein